MNYEFIRQSDATIPDLCYLFRAVHHRDVPESYFRKKYETSWTGKKYIGFIAYDKSGNPVASYAVLPCYLSFNQQKFLVAQAVDATTHPDHRQRGLFVSTAQKTHDLAQSNGILFIFSFPNDNSYHGFTDRLHFHHLANAAMYNVETFALPMVKAANKFNWFRSLYKIWFRTVVTFFKEPQPIPNSVLDSTSAGIEHDRYYFMNKSYENNFRVRFGNFSVWIKLDDGILLGDISRFDKKDFVNFEKQMKLFCFIIGAHQYKIAPSPGTFIDGVFKTKYVPERGYFICGLDLGISDSIPLGAIKFVSGDSDTY